MGKLATCIWSSFWWLSTLLLGFVSVCFTFRFDSCAVVTLFPAWCWLIAGLLLTWIGFSRRWWKWSAGQVALWFVFLLTAADSPLSLVRSVLPEPETPSRLRVVSLNCSSFASAANELVALAPDVALLQESPGRDDLAAMAEAMGQSASHACWGVDASIVANGEVTCVDVPRQHRHFLAHAKIRRNGEDLHILSLRLLPNCVRMDLWSPRCWAAHRTNREKRKRQLQTIADYLTSIPPQEHVILGGDFNAPPGDAAYRSLQPGLRDAFTSAGRGWGATAINDYPVVRIDQIWHSDRLRPAVVRAKKSSSSDHRIVIADFTFDDGT